MMTARLSLALAIAVSLSSFALGEDEKAKVEHRWVRARVTGGTGQGIGIHAKKLPGEFTIPEGRTARNFKYRLDDPKSNYTSDKLTRSSIYSITEKRYIREAENNPKLELPPGKYRFIVGGRPGAQGSLAFDLVSDDTPPADDGPDHTPNPKGKEVLLKLPKDFDLVVDKYFPSRDMANSTPLRGRVSADDRPLVIRVRGEKVLADGRWTCYLQQAGENGHLVEHQMRLTMTGTLRRGVMQGTVTDYWEGGIRTIQYPSFQNWQEGRFHGQADVNGRMTVHLELKPVKALYYDSGRKAIVPNPVEQDGITFTFDVQLPVGESQDSQELSAPPESEATPEEPEDPTADQPVQSDDRRTGDTPEGN